jgi:hypothetical protein
MSVRSTFSIKDRNLRLKVELVTAAKGSIAAIAVSRAEWVAAISNAIAVVAAWARPPRRRQAIVLR